jgi:erythronate-4-phosphate dehydrogenase
MILCDKNIILPSSLPFGFNDIAFIDGRTLTNQDLVDSKCTALFVRSVTKINESLLKSSNVNFVGTATAGIDHIDVKYLNDHSISFASAPGSNAVAVAEYVYFALLSYSHSCKISLRNKVLGIFGLGQVGKRVAKIAETLGMNIIASDPLLEESGIMYQNIEWKTKSEILQQADVISIHTPLTYKGAYPTAKMFSIDEFDIMSASLLIQTSRGGIIDESALLNTLQKSTLLLAIDVWEKEPLWNAHIANHSSTYMATPHIAGYTKTAREKGGEMIVEAYARYTGLHVSELIKQQNYINDNDMFKSLQLHRFAEKKKTVLKNHDVESEFFDACRQQCLQDIETIKDPLL